MATFYTSNLVEVVSQTVVTTNTFPNDNVLYTIPSGHYGRLLWFYAASNSNFNDDTLVFASIKSGNITKRVKEYFSITTTGYTQLKRVLSESNGLTLSPLDSVLLNPGTVTAGFQFRHNLILEVYKAF